MGFACALYAADASNKDDIEAFTFRQFCNELAINVLFPTLHTNACNVCACSRTSEVKEASYIIGLHRGQFSYRHMFRMIQCVGIGT